MPCEGCAEGRLSHAVSSGPPADAVVVAMLPTEIELNQVSARTRARRGRGG
jgi:hypothetical protein